MPNAPTEIVELTEIRAWRDEAGAVYATKDEAIRAVRRQRLARRRTHMIREIEQHYHAAFNRTPNERESFLIEFLVENADGVAKILAPEMADEIQALTDQVATQQDLLALIDASLDTPESLQDFTDGSVTLSASSVSHLKELIRKGGVKILGA